MRTPEFVSFIGIDENTDTDDCIDLSNRFPIEWGVLYGTNPGSKSRYPDEGVIMDFVDCSDLMSLDCALHVCGSKATDFQEGRVETWYDYFDRIQINLLDKRYDFPKLGVMSNIFAETSFIIQHRSEKNPTHQFTALYDTSGGRGTVIEGDYPDFRTEFLMGYAGGINPENVLEINRKVKARGPYYLDMESGIRTDDWLDINKCESICKQLWPNL